MTTDLRKLAEKATPGPWQTDHETDHQSVLDGNGELMVADCAIFGMDVRLTDDRNFANARYIAAANPQAILALLGERDALTARVAELEASAAAAMEGV